MNDLIAAVATPAGSAERSVVRLSGAGVIETLRPRFRSNDFNWYISNATRRYTGEYQIEGWRCPVPVDLWLWPTVRSYTGQPSAELHFVGSPPIVDAILEQLIRDGARTARAGEFTLRAFLAGRLDLTQAEAVLGVIDATDDAQLQTALTQLAGGLSQQISRIRESLLLDLADLEAGLDFVDEDIEFVLRDQLRERIERALSLTRELLNQSQSRMVSVACPRVVLAGLPNAGKSTLFNHLTGGEAAIVSEQAGTTRDYLTAPVEWEGVRLELIDTAGVDLSSSGVARLAEGLRSEILNRSDLVVWCSSLHGTDEELESDSQLRQQAMERGLPLIWVGTQADLDRRTGLPVELSVSALTGEGISQLKTAIRIRLANRSLHQNEWLTSTAARSRDSLLRCESGLESARTACDNHLGDELLSLELRAALDALGEVCGQVHTDDVLDRIFSRFCIGK